MTRLFGYVKRPVRRNLYESGTAKGKALWRLLVHLGARREKFSPLSGGGIPF